MNDTSQYELRDPPADGITQICFSPYNKDLLLVSSWDKVNYRNISYEKYMFFTLFFLLLRLDFTIIQCKK